MLFGTRQRVLASDTALKRTSHSTGAAHVAHGEVTETFLERFHQATFFPVNLMLTNSFS